MLDVNIWDFLNLLTVALCFVFAYVLFRFGTLGSVARLLSLLLVVEGFALLSTGIVFDLFNQAWLDSEMDPSWYAVSWQFHYFFDCAMLALYPMFLAVALKTKLVRPFAKKGVKIGLVCLAAVTFFLAIYTPMTVGLVLLFALLALLFGFALVAATHAWLTAPVGPARSRAGIFMLAFGVRDIAWGYVYLSSIWRIWIGVFGTDADPAWLMDLYRYSTLIYIPIVAYGILHTRMFDIDLRIRWTIKQSTVGIAIFAILFVVSETAESYFSSTLGEYWGFVAAAVIAVTFVPLRRFAEKVASAAMPNTHNTHDYKSERKKRVYEEAVSEAVWERSIAPRERALLVRLRESLGITESEANEIEARLVSG